MHWGTCSSPVAADEGVNYLDFQEDKSSFPWLAVSDEVRSRHSLLLSHLWLCFPIILGFFGECFAAGNVLIHPAL